MEKNPRPDRHAPHHPDARGIFGVERNMDLGIEAFHIHIDQQIHAAQSWAERLISIGYSIEQIIGPLESVRAELEGQIRTYVTNNYERYESQKVISYRLRFLADSMEQRLIWPVMARYGRDHREARNIRGILAESMYGLCAIHLENILGEDGNSKLRHTEGQTRGIIQELTAAALLSKKASANRIALLSSHLDDTQKKIDLDYYAFNGDPETVHIEGLQVKSSTHFHLPLTQRRQQPSVITADMMDNTYDRGVSYPLSRAIIRDVNATADARDEARIEGVLNKPFFRNLIFRAKK